MSHPNKRKGDRAEVAVRDALRRLGFPWCRRTRAGYVDDYGDLHPVPARALTVQVKDVARASYGAWLAEAEQQRLAAGADHTVVIHKRRGVADASQWYAVLTVEQWAQLARQAGYGEPVDRP